jgi:glycosyltransferase involved in cell wall biosynthesis
MRILHVVPFFHPRLGGVEKHAMEICSRLAKGHDVTVLTCSHEKNLPAEETLNGFRIVRLPFAGSRNYLSRLLFYWRFLSGKLRDLGRFDIVHLHDVPCFLWMLPFGGRKVITFHGYERDPVDLLHYWLHKIAEWGTRDNFCVGGYIPKNFGTKCRRENVFIGAVDSAKIRKRSLSFPKKYGKRILFLTRLAWDTQIREYVEVMKLLPGFTLDAYGEGPLKEELKENARKEGVPVRFHGRWPGDSNDLMRKYRFVFASRYLTLLEALANGDIVFSIYNTPVMKDVLECVGAPKNSMVVCRAPEEVAARVLEMAKDGKMAERASREAKAFALPMDWERIVGIYSRTYARLR